MGRSGQLASDGTLECAGAMAMHNADLKESSPHRTIHKGVQLVNSVFHGCTANIQDRRYVARRRDSCRRSSGPRKTALAPNAFRREQKEVIEREGRAHRAQTHRDTLTGTRGVGDFARAPKGLSEPSYSFSLPITFKN
jgi:hypothetical protein